MDIMVHINSLIEGITFPFQYFDDYHWFANWTDVLLRWLPLPKEKMNDVKSQMHKMKEEKKRMDRPPSTLMCYLKMAGKRCVIGFIRIVGN